MHVTRLAKIVQAALESKVGQWPLLAYGPFVRPDDLRNRSVVVRFANSMAPPLASAGLFAYSLSSAIDAVIVEAGPEIPGISQAHYHAIAEKITSFGKLAGFISPLILIYIVAVALWLDHRFWVKIFQTVDVPARPALLKFFVFRTSHAVFLGGLER